VHWSEPQHSRFHLPRLYARSLTVVTSALALTTEDSVSIFSAYLVGGLGIMLSACVNPSLTWMHHAFQAVVLWTVISAVVWFGAHIALHFVAK
jgi:hypothetical protein